MRGITNAFKGVDDTSMAYAKVPTISNVSSALINISISVIERESTTTNQYCNRGTVNAYKVGDALNLFYYENQTHYLNTGSSGLTSIKSKYTIHDTQINFDQILNVTGLPVGSILAVYLNSIGTSGSNTFYFPPIKVYPTVREGGSVVLDVDQSIVYEGVLTSVQAGSTYTKQFFAWVKDVISLGNGGGELTDYSSYPLNLAEGIA